MLDKKNWHGMCGTLRAKNANKKIPAEAGGEFGQALAWALWLTLGPISYPISHYSFKGLHRKRVLRLRW